MLNRNTSESLGQREMLREHELPSKQLAKDEQNHYFSYIYQTSQSHKVFSKKKLAKQTGK